MIFEELLQELSNTEHPTEKGRKKCKSIDTTRKKK
jgi:hypothetical protein